MNQPQVMQPSPPVDTVFRLTAEQFLELCAHEPLASHEGKLELVDGVIVAVNTPNYPHQSYQRQLFKKLDRIFGDGLDGLIAGFESCSRMGERDVRTPDVAVYRDPGAISGVLPATLILLAVEIADSTLAVDLGPRLRSYALAGIPHYWVVDIGGRRTHMFAEPDGDAYLSRSVAAFGAPLAVPGSQGRAITVD